jgi:hypothetical protein
MAVQEVVRQVQRLFGDTSEAQIYIQDIIDWINAGQLEIARQTECLTGTQVIDTSSDDPTDGIALPDDFMREKRVLYNGTALQRTVLEDLDGLGMPTSPAQISDQPFYYYIWSGKMYLYPDPTKVGANMYKLYYIASPVLVASSGDLLSVPFQMYDDVIRFCLMRAKELNEDEQGVNRISAEFSVKMAQGRDEAMHPSDSYPVIRDYPGDSWSVN